MGIEELRVRYDRLHRTTSSINELMPVLMEYGRLCESITELGVHIGQSTTAFLMAQPDELRSIDFKVQPQLYELFEIARLEVDDGGSKPPLWGYRLEDTYWEFCKADSRTINIPKTDLLFIDTTHEYEHLKTELERHYGQVRTWIMLHDTISYGEIGEIPDSRGIMPAIEEFLAEHPEWKMGSHLKYNNGLMILKRV